MTKGDLLRMLAPFDDDLDLCVEHNGSLFEIDRARYGCVSGTGIGVVTLFAGEDASDLRFVRTIELS